MSERPPRPESEHEGYEHVAVADPDWRLTTGKRCRWSGAGHFHSACGQPAVAELNRAAWKRDAKPNWWAYCPDHLYGRWIENGQVMHWILCRIGGEQP